MASKCNTHFTMRIFIALISVFCMFDMVQSLQSAATGEPGSKLSIEKIRKALKWKDGQFFTFEEASKCQHPDCNKRLSNAGIFWRFFWRKKKRHICHSCGLNFCPDHARKRDVTINPFSKELQHDQIQCDLCFHGSGFILDNMAPPLVGSKQGSIVSRDILSTEYQKLFTDAGCFEGVRYSFQPDSTPQLSIAHRLCTAVLARNSKAMLIFNSNLHELSPALQKLYWLGIYRLRHSP